MANWINEKNEIDICYRTAGGVQTKHSVKSIEEKRCRYICTATFFRLNHKKIHTDAKIIQSDFRLRGGEWGAGAGKRRGCML